MNTSAAAIKQRLLGLSPIAKQPYNLLLIRYAQERTLYRISKSPHAAAFMVKGGTLVTALTDNMSRATGDIDVRGTFGGDFDTVRSLITETIAADVEPDGLEFLPDDIALVPIRKDSKYGGIRCTVPIVFGKERIAVQIDIGFGDRVYQPVPFDFPTLIEGMPHARLRAYSPESVIAEKLEAAAALGDDNGRSKDFADIASLAASLPFYAGPLWTAIDLTFTTRGTDIETLIPAIAGAAATPERERHYRAFLKRAHAAHAPPTLADCLSIIRPFIAGPIDFRVRGVEKTWDYTGQCWHEEPV